MAVPVVGVMRAGHDGRLGDVGHEVKILCVRGGSELERHLVGAGGRGQADPGDALPVAQVPVEFNGDGEGGVVGGWLGSPSRSEGGGEAAGMAGAAVTDGSGEMVAAGSAGDVGGVVAGLPQALSRTTRTSRVRARARRAGGWMGSDM